MIELHEGQWIRWTVPGKVREGQVTFAEGPSIVVHWVDGEEQVFPWLEGYSPDARAEHRMEIIPRPPQASQIRADAARDHISVGRAASILGTTKKQVRSWLRSGLLRGSQHGGRWQEVDLDSIEEFRGQK